LTKTSSTDWVIFGTLVISIQDTNLGPQEVKVVISALSSLRSAKSTHQLNQIAHIKANRVRDHISLLQLIVYSNQSTRKSSVLEGITSIPFPREDSIYTKFTTKIILHHNTETSSIIVSWLSRCPNSSGEGCKRLILKLFALLLAIEVKGPYMHVNRRLILIQISTIHVISI